MLHGNFHLAQMNLGRIRAPLTDPIMARFVAKLDEINALADATPGFVWRMGGIHAADAHYGASDEDETARAYAAESILVNMSVWESVEALQRYVYHSAHGALLRDRRDWFEKFEGRWQVLWWVPAGHRPTVAEGKERLDHLRANGRSAWAFDFKEPFPPPAAETNHHTYKLD